MARILVKSAARECPSYCHSKWLLASHSASCTTTLAIVANHSASFLLPQTKRIHACCWQADRRSLRRSQAKYSHLQPNTRQNVQEAPLSNYFGVPPPPPPKRRQTEPPPEQHRKRVFNEKWLDDVGWLATNDERSEMWCKICHEHPSLAD